MARATAIPEPLSAYRRKRDFAVTSEPAPAATAAGTRPVFVVQKHDASRLHWDFRLEHGGVLWSWAVPRGPSLDPHDKRLAVHVEDHPVGYADFHGTIPAGQYGAGTVETWDRGWWEPVGADPAADLARGELKFVVHGHRLEGRYALIRLKARPKERAENWLLIKEHDAHEKAGEDAARIETDIPAPRPRGRTTRPKPTEKVSAPPVPGAVPGSLPAEQAPQLATLTETAPDTAGWVSEIKFDGYRILARIDADGAVKLLTRNGHDWTARLARMAGHIAALGLRDVMLDGELVALDANGRSDFTKLTERLKAGQHGGLLYYAFDLLHQDGWDLRPCRLVDRKTTLAKIVGGTGPVRYSDHVAGQGPGLHRHACTAHLEGIVCKRADAPYRAGRSGDWIKVKCAGREEFVVLGWTPPAGSRTGIGALQVGYFDAGGMIHDAGAVGTGFSDQVLDGLRARLEPMKAAAPRGLLWRGEKPDRSIRWVLPELVAEVRYLNWTGDGRLRHASFLGLRQDKLAAGVVREPPERDASEVRAAVVAPLAAASPRAGPRLTHPEKELWPGISKRDLLEYWTAVWPHAAAAVAGRPLAFVRCPDGIGGQHFFQKHVMPGHPKSIREAAADGAPFLTFDDADGIAAAVQLAAIELHTWGSTAADPAHADRLVFDLDPGEGIGIAELAAAARDVKVRLEQLGLAAFARSSGGKGLHVVCPVRDAPDWDGVRAWCRGFAERMVADSPDRYVAAIKRSIRDQKILIDWLRNGLGSTAVASFSPRARPGAGVATPLAWHEVTAGLGLAAFNLRSVPARLARQKTDPWAGFAAAARPLPELT